MRLLPLFFLLCLSAYAEKDLVGIQEGRIVEVSYTDNLSKFYTGEVVIKNSEGLQIYEPNGGLFFFPWTSIRAVRVLSLEEEAKLRANFPEGKFFPKGKY